MYTTPKGFTVGVINSTALIILMALILNIIFNTSVSLIDTANTPSDTDFPEVLVVFLANFMLLIFFLPFIVFLSKMFPAIRISAKGIECRYLGFWRSVISWHEIDEIDLLKRPKGYCYIAIVRKGFFLLNGLWANTLYGLIFCGQPVPITIIPANEDDDHILTEIRKQIGIRN
jgi:hypothetical protein